MKSHIIIAAFLFMVCASKAQQQQLSNQGLTKFLIRQVILTGADSGMLVLMKLPSNTIKHDDSGKKLYYWDIVAKYHTGISEKALKKMVESVQWLDTSVKIPGFSIQFKENIAGTYENAGIIAKQMKSITKQTFICSVSNPIYSPDGTSCVLFVVGYQMGAYTVEIFKDQTGKWAYKKVYGEWLE